MKRFPWAHIASAALTALGLLLSVACMQRMGGPADLAKVAGMAKAPAGAPGAAVVQGPPGTLDVTIPFPAIGQGRRSQYAYDSGYVYSVELHLYDSQGNYQNYLVVRNTDSSAGLAAGTASVTFSNVPPGLCTLSVHTSQKQYYGSIGSATLITPSPTNGNNAFAVTGVGGVVRSLFSDTTSPFLVFRSNGITGGGADGAPTSVLFAKDTFQARNGLDKELFDTTSVSAGYGTGAATATIAPASTTVINVTVTKAPAWSASMYDSVATEFATVSAGAASTVSAPNNLVAIDKVLIASSSLTLANGDLLDLKDLPDKGLLCTVSAGSMSIPAAIQAGTYTVYPIRGSLVSRIGEIGGKVPPKLVVLPGAISSARVTFSSTDNTLAAGGTSTMSVGLFDAAGNPVKTLDGVTAGLNDGATVSAAVVPTTVATASTYLVSAKTYGSLPAFPRSSTTGAYASLYTQGSEASSPNGVAGGTTISLSGTGRIIAPGFTEFFLPNSLSLGSGQTVTVDATDSAGGSFSLKRGPTIFATSANPITAFVPTPNIPSTAAFNTAIGNFVANAFNRHVIQTDTTALQPADNGTTFTFTSFGNRKVGDKDRVDITVQSSTSAVVATSSITVTWE